MLYLTPLYSNPPVCQLLPNEVALGPWPLSAFSIGSASSYDMGIEGICGIALWVGWRGAPGFEG